MKKADVILIACVLAVSIICFAAFNVFSSFGTTAKIYINNELVDELSLTFNDLKVFETQKGYNIVKIENGSVYVYEANCKNQVCVKKGKIQRKGETIACTPHKFLVEVKWWQSV